MKPADAEEYTQALGQVVAGGWRQIALGERLGVPQALKLSTKEWVNQRLGGYVKYSIAERRRAVAELKAEEPDRPNTKIAEVFGVEEITIRRDLQSTNVETPINGGRKTQGKPSSEKTSSTNVEPAPLDVLTGLAADDAVRREVDRVARNRQREDEREAIRDARPAQPLPTGRYALLYADPPWQYEHVATESRAIENQYPTMTLDEICALDIPAADEAVLYLWATAPKLAEAIRVLDAWRFNYRTCAVWDKEQIGMGYYFRQQHELLLVAARGAFPVPPPTARPSSVLRARRGAHSEKPAFVYDLLEMMYPTLGEADRVELFARDRRPGWAVWGNEVLA